MELFYMKHTLNLCLKVSRNDTNKEKKSKNVKEIGE